MKNITVFILLFSLISCKCYIDNPKYGKTMDYSSFKIHQFPNYNLLESRKKIPAKADTEIYYPQHFDVHIPKKIKTWAYLGNTIYVEYDYGQILAIDTDYIDSKTNAINWILLNDEDKIRVYRYDFLSRNDKKCNYDKAFSSNRITRLYTNGKTKILLYNIKPENFTNFEKIKDSYKYMN